MSGMILDFFKRKEKPKELEKTFPEKGTYQELGYRIDGDSVMLKWGNGVELEFRVPAEMTQSDFDEKKKLIEIGRNFHFPLILWDHESLQKATKSDSGTKEPKRNAYPTGNFFKTAEKYGWTPQAQFRACEVAGEILANYWRSRAKIKNKI